MVMPLGDPMGGQAPERDRGRLRKLAQVWVPVSDLEQALDLYTNVLKLGLVAENREKGYIEVGAPDGEAILVLYLPEPNDEEQPGIRTGVVFCTDSIYDFHKVLVDEGVDFTLKPQRDRNGRLVARFTDDDGNEFEVVDVPKEQGG